MTLADKIGRYVNTMAEICYNQSDFDYRREIGENQSSLKHILESPAHYKASKEKKFITTPAMEIGTALHCKVLEGDDTFDASYVLKPEGISLATKEGKEWKASIGRKRALTEGGRDDSWGAVRGMTESLRKLAWFDGSQPNYRKFNELSLYWDWNNIPCKARLDRLLVDEGIVLDLKTTDSIESHVFLKKVIGFKYDFQAAFYAKAAEIAFGKKFRFIFVAVERKAPYTVDLFEVSDYMMEEASNKCDLAISRLAGCLVSDEWPNREPVIHQLDYPAWYNPVQQTVPTDEFPF